MDLHVVSVILRSLKWYMYVYVHMYSTGIYCVWLEIFVGANFSGNASRYTPEEILLGFVLLGVQSPSVDHTKPSAITAKICTMLKFHAIQYMYMCVCIGLKCVCVL